MKEANERTRVIALVETVFKAGLKEAPGNGWMIYGLKEAQLKLGDAAGAKESEDALAKAWAGPADLLALSRL